ncbi:MAG: hypothetical protein ABEL76_14090 [Bradymonadaceae bacterium]
MSQQKPLELVTVDPPAPDRRASRSPRPAGPDEAKNRYHLPEELDSPSPVGYRERVGTDRETSAQMLELLSLDRPEGFVGDPNPVPEQELFEECSLGILTARQSTNFRGHRETLLGPEDSERAAELMRGMEGLEAPVLDGATHTHVVFSRPYRTLFTLLLTFVGHPPLANLLTVPIRALRKVFLHESDIPTVDYLQQLHVGILADDLERAAIVASGGDRRAQIFMAPFAGDRCSANADAITELEELAGLTAGDRRKGWQLALVAQVGEVPESARPEIDDETYRLFGANKMAARSERIVPGVNQDENAPDEYQIDQQMDVPDELTVQCGRAAYNAFSHWTGVDRDAAKQLLLLDRIDTETPEGSKHIDEVRSRLEHVTEQLIDDLPLWADLLSGFALSRNAERGRKAFALAGQRIYIGGLDRSEVEAADLEWHAAIRAAGAASCRSALYAEIMGWTEVPEECDLLAGICQMAGPVNQNDIGKQFYGQDDLLADTFPDRNPTSLLVWTLKAKTVADPIGNEEQLLSEEHQGALVDLRPGPHEVIDIREGNELAPMRRVDGEANEERAFADVGNFATSADDEPIPGNRGSRWPADRRERPVWPDESPDA